MNKILIMGDIHGNIIPISKLVHQEKLDSSDLVILLGDVGLNYYLTNQDKKFKKEMSKFPCKFYCLRGNHEQRPSLIPSMKLITEADGPMYMEDKYPNIFYFSDIPQEYHIGGYSVLTLPGAYSVDKEYRIRNNWNWFPQEQISLIEWTEFRPHEQYDLILSHTCPFCWEPTDLFLSFINQKTVDQTMERWFQEFEFNHIYKFWLFGHYHQTRIYPTSISNCNGQPIMLYNDAFLNLDEAMMCKLKDDYPGKAIYSLNNN